NTEIRAYEDLDKFGLYPNGGTVTAQPEILFARIDFKEIAPKIAEIQEKQKAEYEAEQAIEAGGEAPKTEAAPADPKTDESRFIDIDPKAEITYDDFAKLQFRVGVIVKCEEVPKSKKLLCSQVKVGSKTLQIVSGIKKDYSPEQMVGKHVMVLTNLKPATLAGIQSEGMLLCAEDENGELALMSPEKFMPSGAEIC
ncbi:MAG: methionine--tRNA ligase subunit beta, partial [Lachnospiraceae bacterium]|nr:methionine--tRNA ligase subunit beta [Lachnospiraceae bacterium]